MRENVMSFWDDVGDFFEGAAETAGDVAEDIGNAFGEAAEDTGDAFGDGFDAIGGAFDDAQEWINEYAMEKITKFVEGGLKNFGSSEPDTAPDPDEWDISTNGLSVAAPSEYLEIGPRGSAIAFQSALESVALNPQPLPPGPDDYVLDYGFVAPSDYLEIGPRGSVIALQSALESVALNPQPLPPGPDDYVVDYGFAAAPTEYYPPLH
jgi:hypothetical protein